MKAAAPAPPLDPAQARFRADVRALGIASSEDVAPSQRFGDARGEEALGLALDSPSLGYHAFVCGAEGPDRLERIAAVVAQQMRREAPRRDWIYVHNFADPSRPRAIGLPAGEGQRLREELRALLRRLQQELPKAFREEAFDEEKAQLIEAFEKEHLAQQQAMEELAARAGFAIAATPHGLTLLPLVDGRPPESEEQIRALGDERLQQIEQARRGLLRQLRDHLMQERDRRHRVDEEIRKIEREFAGRIVRARVGALAERFADSALTAHLRELTEHVLDHLEAFRGEGGGQPLALPFLAVEPQDPFAIYDVNVVVDNRRTDRPPLLVVDSPTYKNLFGTIDRSVDAFGRLTTDFRRIQAGALARASGGAVVIAAEDALVEPFVWRILRRALRSGRVEVEAYDPFVAFTPSSLRPEPIPVDTKVVLVGARWIFEMLLALDEEFGDLFKVMADFSPVVERTEASTRDLCGRVAATVRDERLLPFEASGLEALVELSVREAGDRRRLDLGGERVLDAAREASAFARRAGRSKATRDDVAEALRRRVRRLDRIEEELRDAVARGVLRIALEGSAVGQVNAVSVSELGGRAFGRPTRVTATVGFGAEGVVSIDRETKLSGPTHDKGVLILEGFLRTRFAAWRPLSLVASVTFEQSYAHVEGDSASLAELLAILSRVGEFPLRQDLAVTGSVDQLGEVQAVGGVNEKIEGFFDCCAARGFSGEPGVVLPATNVEHLALREDVCEALEAGRFRLYPVRHVDEALELFTGCAAGAPGEIGTLNHVLDQAFDALAQRMHEYAKP